MRDADCIAFLQGGCFVPGYFLMPPIWNRRADATLLRQGQRRLPTRATTSSDVNASANALAV